VRPLAWGLCTPPPTGTCASLSAPLQPLPLPLIVPPVLQRGGGPVLIVCPLAVLNNWVREFTRFAPHVKLCKYYGTQEERAALRLEHITRAAYDERGVFVPRRLPVFLTT
jgi:hypothetical protein